MIVERKLSLSRVAISLNMSMRDRMKQEGKLIEISSKRDNKKREWGSVIVFRKNGAL